jgi:RNA polymerase primary sigma factor
MAHYLTWHRNCRCFEPRTARLETMKTPDECEPALALEPPSPGARDSVQAETCLELYLRDVGRVKLLTPQEEIDLAERIKNGEREARDQMIKSNLRLVITMARAYEGLGLPLLDLISEGNIGLMRAVDRFDPSKGAKFGYYGAFWIKQAIIKALAGQSKLMRLPTHVVDKLRRVRRAESRLEEDLGREPTGDELASEVGMSSLRVNQMRMAALRPTSLDAEIEGGETGNYAEIVPDEEAESPYEKLEDKALTAMVQEMLQSLDEREQVILRLRFGLEGESPKTLQETGGELGVSSERVRQLQKSAIEKLRRRINSLENRSLSPTNPKSGNQCTLRL